MDGYALRARDTFTATEREPVRLKIGVDAHWIETGDPLPDGFDAVIPVEDVNLRDGFIEIYASVPPYNDVRPIGEDIVATELIIPESHVVRAADIGAILASGICTIDVRRKPLIGIIPTGSELIDASKIKEKMPEPPQLIEYNSAVLASLTTQTGAEPKIYSIVRDEEKEIKDAILNALKECDIVLLNAGSGYGKEDFTYKVINELGEVSINGVAIRPGKPFIAGFVNNRPVLGIPGYPVSSF